MVHDGDICIDRTDEGDLMFRRPDGRRIEPVPPTSWSGGRVVPEGVGAASLRVWDGTPFNVVNAIDVLHPRANPARQDPVN
jgi:hypothetical protein